MCRLWPAPCAGGVQVEGVCCCCGELRHRQMQTQCTTRTATIQMWGTTARHARVSAQPTPMSGNSSAPALRSFRRATPDSGSANCRPARLCTASTASMTSAGQCLAHRWRPGREGGRQPRGPIAAWVSLCRSSIILTSSWPTEAVAISFRQTRPVCQNDLCAADHRSLHILGPNWPDPALQLPTSLSPAVSRGLHAPLPATSCLSPHSIAAQTPDLCTLPFWPFAARMTQSCGVSGRALDRDRQVTNELSEGFWHARFQ